MTPERPSTVDRAALRPTVAPTIGHAARPRRLRRWLPHPWLSALLAAVWLALADAPSVAQLLLALALGLIVPQALGHLFGRRPSRDALSRTSRVNWKPVPMLAAVVLRDIVGAGCTVAAQTLWRMNALRPAWVTVPYALDDPRAIGLLATIVTNTAGTVSCIVDAPRSRLLVHVLHCPDAAATVTAIRLRYESRLARIFVTETSA